MFGSVLAAADAGRRLTRQRFGVLSAFVVDGPFGAANVSYGGPAGLGGSSTRIQAPSNFDVPSLGLYKRERHPDRRRGTEQ